MAASPKKDASITFFPVGNADTLLVTLSDDTSLSTKVDPRVHAIATHVLLPENDRLPCVFSDLRSWRR
jgi:hypothetical protein